MRYLSSKPALGQSLAEYAFLIGFVGLASLGILTVMGSALDDSVAMAGQGIMGGGLQGISGSGGASGSGGSGDSGSTSETESSGTDSGASSFPTSTTTAYGDVSAEQVCYDSGFCIDIPVVADNWSETSGSMGSDMTYSLADVFTQVADELELSGNADGTLLSALRSLADRGHQIGFEQSALAGAIETYCPTADCTFNLLDSEIALASHEILPDAYSAKDGSPQVLTEFNNLAEHVLSPIYDDSYNSLSPQLKDLVTQEINQIKTLADSTPWVLIDSSTLQFTGSSNDEASLTHQSANTICDAGDGGETCTVPQ